MRHIKSHTHQVAIEFVKTTAFTAKVISLALCLSLIAYAEGGNTFTRVRYNGGSFPSKVDAKDWNNKLTVTSEAITFEFKDKQTLTIPPKSVTSLSYGQEAHRRVGTMVALAILVAPVALFGLFHKTRLHYIGIQYTTADTKNAGILLQGDKDNYRAMLVALQGVTGAPVSVAEKEREFLPVGVTTTSAAKETPGTASPAKGATGSAQALEDTGTVTISTTPDGAEIYADGQFYGNSPATLKLKPGKHNIVVKNSGYKDWARDISTDSGSESRLGATLEKVN